jgi:hypothetical protein
MLTDPAAKLSNGYGPEVVHPHDLGTTGKVSAIHANPSDKESMTKSLIIPSGPTVPSNTRRNSLHLGSLGLALLVFFDAAIVLGAGLGGGLGAKLASCQNQLQK